MKQKTEIKPGQIWRDKRDHARQIRVIKYEAGRSPGGHGFTSVTMRLPLERMTYRSSGWY